MKKKQKRLVLTAALVLIVALSLMWWSEKTKAEQTVGLNVIIYHIDGTVEVYQRPQGAGQLSVIVGSYAISRIVVVVQIDWTLTGVLSEGTGSGTVRFLLDGAEKKAVPISGKLLGGGGQIGGEQQGCQVTASEIESWDAGAYTTHTLALTASITATAKFTDGTQVSKSGTAQTNVTVSVQRTGAITAMNIQFVNQIMY